MLKPTLAFNSEGPIHIGQISDYFGRSAAWSHITSDKLNAGPVYDAYYEVEF